MQTEKKNNKYKRFIPIVFIAVGMAGLLGSLGARLYIRSAKPKANNPAVSSSPSETPTPKQNQPVSYVVPAENPKFLTIEAIGINNAKIVKLGLQNNNQIANPSSVHEVGWYQQSKKPSEKGTMFLYGHLSDWTSDGIFAKLKNLKPDQTIKVTRGDDKTYTYKMVSSKIYKANAVNMDEVLTPINGSAQGLSLMTCTGKLDIKTNEFEERLVVFAVPL